MIFLNLWRYFVGYLVIRVEGLSLEKFINLCVSRGLKLWKVNRTNYTSLTACIDIKGFRELPSVTRIVRCRIKIIEKRGLPFLAYKLRNRKMLMCGMLVFLVVLYGLSSLIWVVEVEGTVQVNPDIITAKLEEKGIKPGVYKGKLDISRIENAILIDIPELSWMSIEIRGTRAIARVAEATKPPKLVDTRTPCNIVALKDGVIDSIIVLQGQAMVEEGQTVRKGQLLVSGIIEHEDTQIVRYVRATAQIMTRTWYEGKAQVLYEEISHIRTGEMITHNYYEISEWQLIANKEPPPFANYEVVEYRTPILRKGIPLPFYRVTREFYETQSASPSQQKQLALEKAQNNAWADAYKKIPLGVKIIDKKFKYDMIKDIGVDAVVYVEALEDISQPVEILMD